MDISRNGLGFDETLLRQLETELSSAQRSGIAAGRILYEISHDTLVNAIEMVAQFPRAIEEGDKRKRLEETLAEERKRAEYLTELNAKSRLPSRLAIGLAVVSLFRGRLCFFLLEISRERPGINAIESTEKAVAAEKQARVNLFENNMQKARDPARGCEETAIYLSADYELCPEEPEEADTLLRSDVDLPAQDEFAKKELLAAISEGRKICQQSNKIIQYEISVVAWVSYDLNDGALAQAACPEYGQLIAGKRKTYFQHSDYRQGLGINTTAPRPVSRPTGAGGLHDQYSVYEDRAGEKECKAAEDRIKRIFEQMQSANDRVSKLEKREEQCGTPIV